MTGMNFTADDMVKVIKACRQSGVSSFHYDTLDMKFDTNSHPNKTKKVATHMDVGGEDSEGQPPGPSSSFDHQQFKDDELMIDEQLDLLNIEDPALHEELQIKLMNKGATT